MIKEDSPQLQTYTIQVKPALNKLSRDIVIQILSFLQPDAIVAVRQVCGSFFQFSFAFT